VELGKESVKLVNLTPHPIDIFNEQGEKILSIPPSGVILRAITKKVKIGEVNGVPIYKVEYNIPRLPEPREDTVYIVSSIILQILKIHEIQRSDILAPDTSNPVRDQKGNIIGVKAFIVMGDEYA